MIGFDNNTLDDPTEDQFHQTVNTARRVAGLQSQIRDLQGKKTDPKTHFSDIEEEVRRASTKSFPHLLILYSKDYEESLAIACLRMCQNNLLKKIEGNFSARSHCYIGGKWHSEPFSRQGSQVLAGLSSTISS